MCVDQFLKDNDSALTCFLHFFSLSPSVLCADDRLNNGDEGQKELLS